MRQELIEKKKFDKKKLLSFVVVGVLALALVSAATYYAVFSATIHFTQPISTSGDLTSDVTFPVGTFTALGHPITVSNAGTTESTIVISNDNINPNVKVSYVGELSLSHKDLMTWVSSGTPVTITYTMIGNTFKVSGVPTGLVAVYYPNTVDYTHYDGAVVLANGVTTNLPVSNDLNGNSLTSNYLTIKNSLGNLANPSATQAVGAKIWLVPTGAVTNNVIDWSQASSFYFETSLIQFNTAGNIVISPGSSITFTPQFDIDKYAGTGSVTITTTVK